MDTCKPLIDNIFECEKFFNFTYFLLRSSFP